MARTLLYDTEIDKTPLRSPLEVRKEMLTLSKQLDTYKQFKETQRALGRRDRVIKTGWRHGVLGVDDADSN